MVHRSNPIRTTANPPAWKASSARVRQDAASATRPHRDSFDSMDSKCLTQISDLSTLSERDDEDDDQNEEEENESIETIEQPKEPLVTPSPQINMTSIVPLLQLSTIGTWYPLCTLQKQEKKDSFGGKVPIFPRVGIDPFFFEGLHSKLGLLTTSLKSQTSSPKSSFSEDFHTDIEDMEEVQLSFTNKATLSLLIILEQRSLRIDQFNAIMSFLHHLYQLPSASCNTTYEIFHFLALYPELSYEIALYMQALNCSIDNLPFFKGKEQKTLSENICQKNSSIQSFIFGGDLTKSQVQEIISHFLRYTMNLLQDILGDLQKLTYGSESMNEFIACGSCSQFYSFQKELTQSFNYLSRQYDLITTL